MSLGDPPTDQNQKPDQGITPDQFRALKSDDQKSTSTTTGEKKKPWVFLHASVAGASHLTNNQPCQDAHLCKPIPNSDWIICIVADGAGSKKHSEIGSQKVVNLLYNHSINLINEKNWVAAPYIPTDQEWHKIACSLFKETFRDLKRFAEDHGYKIEDLSTTAILTIVTPRMILASHIGDGHSGYRNSEGEWKNLTVPFKGEYINETMFLTSIKWEEKDENNHKLINSAICTEEFDVVILLSDGCAPICYESQISNSKNDDGEIQYRPFGNFLNPLIDKAIELFTNGMSQSEINKNWERYLINGHPRLQTEPDDKTLIIVFKMPNETTNHEQL